MAEITQAVNESPDDAYLTISRTAAYYLHETSKWAYFLSILGFIVTGIIVVAALFISSIMSAMTQGQSDTMPQGTTFFMSFIYVLMGVLYFFPSLYLYRYTQKLKSALTSKDSNELVAAFENQKSLYKFWGIFAIVIISFYALMAIFFLGMTVFR